jgi:hypothetical protein
MVLKRLQPQQILTEVLTGNASRRASKLLTRRLLAKPLLLFLQTSVPGLNYYDARGQSRHVFGAGPSLYEGDAFVLGCPIS